MIRAHVPHWEASVADYRSASEATRRSLPSRRNIPYGAHPDSTLDLFSPEQHPEASAPRPVHLFIHGGYWRSFSKDDYSFVADCITASGAIAAIVDYSLMPAARMDLLVSQVRQAALWLADHASEFGGDPRAITASGHSAGAHLASFLVCRGTHEPEALLPDIQSVLLVSGLYDLAPITRSFLQAEVELTEEEVARGSPVSAVPVANAEAVLMVGAQETAPFHDQAAAFADHVTRLGARSRLATVPGQDHMTIVRELGRPGTSCARFLEDLIAASRPR
jgi:arylformamidase